jgi:hypothetical protein
MFMILRAELKAIVNWNHDMVQLRTLTEREAMGIREMRRGEILQRLKEIASQN